MKKNIIVNRISLNQLERLHNLGYEVFFDNLTPEAADNTAIKYIYADEIKVWKQKNKYVTPGTEAAIAKMKGKRK